MFNCSSIYSCWFGGSVLIMDCVHVLCVSLMYTSPLQSFKEWTCPVHGCCVCQAASLRKKNQQCISSLSPKKLYEISVVCACSCYKVISYPFDVRDSDERSVTLTGINTTIYHAWFFLWYGCGIQSSMWCMWCIVVTSTGPLQVMQRVRGSYLWVGSGFDTAGFKPWSGFHETHCNLIVAFTMYYSLMINRSCDGTCDGFRIKLRWVIRRKSIYDLS